MTDIEFSALGVRPPSLREIHPRTPSKYGLLTDFQTIRKVLISASPTLIAVAALAILLELFPSVALVPVLLWPMVAIPLVGDICRGFGSCQAVGYEGQWVFWISFLPFVFPAFWFAWKLWSVSERWRLYLNLLILAVGVPETIIVAVATAVRPE